MVRGRYKIKGWVREIRVSVRVWVRNKIRGATRN